MLFLCSWWKKHQVGDHQGLNSCSRRWSNSPSRSSYQWCPSNISSVRISWYLEFIKVMLLDMTISFEIFSLKCWKSYHSFSNFLKIEDRSQKLANASRCSNLKAIRVYRGIYRVDWKHNMDLSILILQKSI